MRCIVMPHIPARHEQSLVVRKTVPAIHHVCILVWETWPRLVARHILLMDKRIYSHSPPCLFLIQTYPEIQFYETIQLVVKFPTWHQTCFSYRVTAVLMEHILLCSSTPSKNFHTHCYISSWFVHNGLTHWTLFVENWKLYQVYIFYMGQPCCVLLAMTVWVSLSFSSALVSMTSSTVALDTRRIIFTGRVCPILCARAAACRSI